MKLKKYVLFILFSLLSNIALSESYSIQYQQCLDESGGVTRNMLDCIEQEYQRQDKRLNSLYQQLMGMLGGIQKQKLRNAQRQWIKFRDLNCEYYLDTEGGTLAVVVSADCRVWMTTDRADELQSILDSKY